MAHGGKDSGTWGRDNNKHLDLSDFKKQSPLIISVFLPVAS